MSTDVLTIALTLAGFVAGLLIALLYAGARSRSLNEAHAARVNGLLADLTAAEKTAQETRDELAARTQAAASAESEARALQSELGIHKAQLEESQASLGEIEDRLNAAEARLLSADALLADRGREVAEWRRAYTLLRSTHDSVLAEHDEAERRRQALEDDLQEKRLELADLGARLEALQMAALQGQGDDDAPTTLQQRVTAISLLKATAEAGLRRRELELADVRSQLSALRYSINVLTASAAELAALAGGALFGIEAPQPREDEALPPRAVTPAREITDPTRLAEEMAGLEGMIADWFAEVRRELPYAPAVLRAFAGASGALPAPAAEGPDAAEPAEPAASAALPPALMLAAIKAVATTALQRSTTRQYELAARLTDSEAAFDTLATRIKAWRSMLFVTLQNDPDLLRLLEQQDDPDAAAMLSACATVALTAYQKKQQALRRLEQGATLQPTAPAAPPAPRLAPPPARPEPAFAFGRRRR